MSAQAPHLAEQCAFQGIGLKVNPPHAEPPLTGLYAGAHVLDLAEQCALQAGCMQGTSIRLMPHAECQAGLRTSPSSMAASAASRAAATAAAFSSDSLRARRRAAEIFAAAAARGSPPPPLAPGPGLGLLGLGLPEPRPPRRRSLAGGGVAPLPLAWPGGAAALSVSACFLRGAWTRFKSWIPN